MEITFDMSPTEWGDTCSYDEESDRMVPTIVPGAQIKFAIDLSLVEAGWNGWRVFPKASSSGEMELRCLGDRLNFCYFRGRVLRIQESTRSYLSKDPFFALWRGLKRVTVFLNCGLPVSLSGPIGESAELGFQKGDILEGVSHLAGSTDEREYEGWTPLEGLVINVRQLGPIPMKGSQEGYHLVTASVANATEALNSWARYNQA